MRMYQAAPDFSRPMGSDIPLVTVTTASNVCSTDAFTMSFPDPRNRYSYLLTLNFTDDEFDDLLEQMAAARAKRVTEQERTYEALHAKFGGTWDNALAKAPIDCRNCGGSGQTGNADDPESCNTCRGTGIVDGDE